jgi:hypothetical protein
MSQDPEIPFYKRLWFGVGSIATILIIATIVIGYMVVNSYEEERSKATTKAICEILKQESKAHPLLPDVLVINVSSKDQKQISDSIRKDVSKYLIERYTIKSEDTSQIEIHPYVSFLEKSNNKPITGEQVAELKKYIQFLVSNCDKAVEDSKRNIDTEISKINTWVTIWIGVFGLLGIFIPIVVNLKSFDALKDIERKANAAANKINKHKADIEAIAGIKTDVANATLAITAINNTLPNLTTQSTTALQNSTTALNLSNFNQTMLVSLEAIGKLSKLENIVLYGGANRNQLIHSLLSSILRSFQNLTEHHNADFYRDLLAEVCDRLTELSRATMTDSRNNAVAMSTFALFIHNRITTVNPLTNADHNEIVTNFEAMLNTLTV